MDASEKYASQIKKYYTKFQKALYLFVGLTCLGLLLGIFYFSSYGVIIFISLTGVGFALMLIMIEKNIFLCPGCGKRIDAALKVPESCPQCDLGVDQSEVQMANQEKDIEISSAFQREKINITQWGQRFLMISIIIFSVTAIFGILNHSISRYLQWVGYPLMLIYIAGRIRFRFQCPACQKKLHLQTKADIKFCPYCHVKLQ